MIKQAARFAKERHKNQKRKYTGEPYFKHLKEVADLLISVNCPKEIVCAGYLHDIIEDTETTIEEIKEIFGEVVAKLVLEVTDISKPSDGNRKVRKKIDCEHLAKASNAGATIKCADIISNTQTICDYDIDFAKIYLKEIAEVMDILQGKAHPGLFFMASLTVMNAMNQAKML